MCLCVKECAADALFRHVTLTFHMLFCVCIGVNESPVSVVLLALLCALDDASAAIQAQSVVLWFCLKAQMGLRHKRPDPKGPGNLSENRRSRFILAGHVLKIPFITPALPGNHRHSQEPLFAL